MTNQNTELVYKYVSIRRKNKSVEGVSENGRNQWFPLTKKSVSTSTGKVIFQKLDFPYSFQ